MEYNLSIAGGTFDHLHEGHKAFLRFIFSHSSKAIIGMTSNAYVRDNKGSGIQSFTIRKKNLETFLIDEGFTGRFDIVEINDIYGVALDSNLSVDALIATEDTKDNAQHINSMRQSLGLAPLELVIMPLVKNGQGVVFSSTSIRQNKQICEYSDPQWGKEDLRLPESLRSKLHEPFGVILADIPDNIDPSRLVTVGDVTTKLCNIKHIGQAVSIVDFVVERHERFHSLQELGFTSEEQVFVLENPAAHVVAKAWNCIAHALRVAMTKRVVIHVTGEEDLLVLPCILLAPVGWHILYGQPHQGLVHVIITKKMQDRASQILGQFLASH